MDFLKELEELIRRHGYGDVQIAEAQAALRPLVDHWGPPLPQPDPGQPA